MSTIARSCGPIHGRRDRGRVPRTQSSLVGQFAALGQRAALGGVDVAAHRFGGATGVGVNADRVDAGGSAAEGEDAGLSRTCGRSGGTSTARHQASARSGLTSASSRPTAASVPIQCATTCIYLVFHVVDGDSIPLLPSDSSCACRATRRSRQLGVFVASSYRVAHGAQRSFFRQHAHPGGASRPARTASTRMDCERGGARITTRGRRRGG